MLRVGLVLMLICAAAPALASQPGALLVPSGVLDRDPDAADGDATDTSAEKAKPSLSPGGGSDDDAMLPRSRSLRWHRLLPGMFR